MKISNKIEGVIDNLNETYEFKTLMKTILVREDSGIKHYTNVYEKLVDEYIDEGDQND